VTGKRRTKSRTSGLGKRAASNSSTLRALACRHNSNSSPAFSRVKCSSIDTRLAPSLSCVTPLSRARKTPIALVLGSKSVSTRRSSRSFDHAQTKRSHTQIFASLADRPSGNRSSAIDRNRLEITKKADDFVESAASYSLVETASPRTRAPRNRTHTEPPTTSPVSQTFPRRGPQNHLPPRAALAPSSAALAHPTSSLCSFLEVVTTDVAQDRSQL
jgi:hypothetical protein